MSSNLNLLEQSLDPETAIGSFVNPVMAEKRLPKDVFHIMDIKGKFDTICCLLHSWALYDSGSRIRIHFGPQKAEKIAP